MTVVACLQLDPLEVSSQVFYFQLIKLLLNLCHGKQVIPLVQTIIRRSLVVRDTRKNQNHYVLPKSITLPSNRDVESKHAVVLVTMQGYQVKLNTVEKY